MRITRSIIGLATLLSVLAPLSASAATLRNHVVTPDGFCAVADDNTIGVRFDGWSYTKWLMAYAADQVSVDTALRFEESNRSAKGLAEMTEQDKSSFVSRFKTDAAFFQIGFVKAGQSALCRQK